jgi:hypothetical protein
VSLLHFRHRRRLALLATGALVGAEGDEALRHASSCADCARELEEMRGVLARIALDPVRSAEMPIRTEALKVRVLARLEEAEKPWAWWPASRRVLAPGLGGAAAVAVLLAFLVSRPAVREPLSPVVTVSENALARLERTVAREQAVRYLNDAQDVLVTVAAAPRACRRTSERVDVGEEARRSRELLSRRALLLDVSGDAVPTAAPLLRDVEEMLHEVALLEPCARARDLETIHREIGRRNLLMKIDLVTRELQG